MQVWVCGTCPLGKDGFADKLRLAFGSGSIAADVVQVDCMSGCARESTIAFRSPGKMAYLFGDLTEADLPDLHAFAALYAASPDGQFADARPLGALRMKALARIPG
jgi:predicted metal-binding protein